MKGLEQYYANLWNYTRAVANGHHTALMVHSPHGIGKSYQINKTLEDELGEFGYEKRSGFSTPLAFFRFLQDNRNSVIFLDDIAGLMNKKKVLSNLKQATWSADDDERVVTWDTSIDQDGYENEFVFNGQIIMCLNDMPENELVSSLRSRTLYYELNFSYEEKLEIMQIIMPNIKPDMDSDKKQEVFDWIEKFTYPGSGIDLRTLVKLLKFRQHNPDDWRQMAGGILNIDMRIKSDDSNEDLVKKLLYRHNKVEDARKEFQEVSGKSRRTFFRAKKKLED